LADFDLRDSPSIPRRHTHRAPFDTTRNLSQITLSGLDHEVADIQHAAVVWITSDTAKRQVGQLVVEGAQAISADHDLWPWFYRSPTSSLE